MVSEIFGGPHDGLLVSSECRTLRLWTMPGQRVAHYVRLGDDYQFSGWEQPEAVDCCSCGQAIPVEASVEIQGRCMCETCFFDCGRGVE